MCVKNRVCLFPLGAYRLAPRDRAPRGRGGTGLSWLSAGGGGGQGGPVHHPGVLVVGHGEHDHGWLRGRGAHVDRGEADGVGVHLGRHPGGGPPDHADLQQVLLVLQEAEAVGDRDEELRFRRGYQRGAVGQPEKLLRTQGEVSDGELVQHEPEFPERTQSERVNKLEACHDTEGSSEVLQNRCVLACSCMKSCPGC